MLQSKSLRSAALYLSFLSAGMVSAAVARRPAVLDQPGSWIILLEFGALLAAYASAAIFSPRLLCGSRIAALREGTVFGCVTAAIEIVNLGLETWRPDFARGAVSIVFMLVVFLLWVLAAARAANSSGSIGVGALAAVVSAALCMLIAVSAGLLIELFVALPDPAAVAHWAEFRRSGWSDVRLFALANSVDSASAHLLIAPVVAVVMGVVGSLLGKIRSR